MTANAGAHQGSFRHLGAAVVGATRTEERRPLHAQRFQLKANFATLRAIGHQLVAQRRGQTPAQNGDDGVGVEGPIGGTEAGTGLIHLAHHPGPLGQVVEGVFDE